MKPKAFNYATDNLFNFALTVSLIGILISTALFYLNRTQNQVETTMMETDLANIRWELRELWAHRNAKGQSLASEEIDNANPFQLINEPLKNYSGEHPETPPAAQTTWYFNTQSKRLVYVFRDGRQVRYRLTNTAKLNRASIGTLGGIDLVPD